MTESQGELIFGSLTNNISKINSAKLLGKYWNTIGKDIKKYRAIPYKCKMSL